MRNGGDGCFLAFVVLIVGVMIAWAAFVIWAIVTVINWLTSQTL